LSLRAPSPRRGGALGVLGWSIVVGRGVCVGISPNAADARSVLVIKAVARNCLAAAAGTRFKVAAEFVQEAAANAAIVACRQVEIIGAIAVREASVFFAVDDEFFGLGR
jgi:hypothetical protein